MKRFMYVAVALGVVLVGCSHPQELPVAISRCDAVQTANGFNVDATVENKSTKPISNLDLTTDFYQNFRYQKFTATVRLKTELDPGQKRDVTFEVASGGARLQGEAMRCLVTHIGYLDGTTQDIPPAHN